MKRRASQDSNLASLENLRVQLEAALDMGDENQGDLGAQAPQEVDWVWAGLDQFRDQAGRIQQYVQRGAATLSIFGPAVRDAIGNILRGVRFITGIKKEEFVLYLDAELQRDINWTTINVPDLLLARGKILDIFLFLDIPVEERARHVTWVEAGEKLGPRNPQDVSKPLFAEIFMALTRGGPSDAATNEPGSDIPKFLLKIITDEGWNFRQVANKLTNHDINLISFDFIREVPLAGLPREVHNRLRKTNVGRRYALPFVKFYYKNFTDVITHEPAQVAEYIGRLPPNFDTHPLTMTQEWADFAGPFNANLRSLVLAVYGPQRLERFVQDGILPTERPDPTTGDKWRTWRMRDIPAVVTMFFPGDQLPDATRVEPNLGQWDQMGDNAKNTYPAKSVAQLY